METEWTLRSTALGGRFIAEYGSTGVSTTSYAYAGGEVLAVAQGVNTTPPSLRWQHTNPVTGDARETDATGRVTGETHLDPGGADVGVESPFTSAEGGEEGGGAGEGMSQSSVDARVAQLVPGWGGPQCSINGLSAGCGFVDGLVRGEAGRVCPEGDCGAGTAKVIVTYNDGKRLTYLVPLPLGSLPSGFSETFTGAAARVAAGMWNESVVRGEGVASALYWSLFGGRIASGRTVDNAASYFAPQNPIRTGDDLKKMIYGNKELVAKINECIKTVFGEENAKKIGEQTLDEKVRTRPCRKCCPTTRSYLPLLLARSARSSPSYWLCRRAFAVRRTLTKSHCL